MTMSWEHNVIACQKTCANGLLLGMERSVIRCSHSFELGTVMGNDLQTV